MRPAPIPGLAKTALFVLPGQRWIYLVRVFKTHVNVYRGQADARRRVFIPLESMTLSLAEHPELRHIIGDGCADFDMLTLLAATFDDAGPDDRPYILRGGHEQQ